MWISLNEKSVNPRNYYLQETTEKCGCSREIVSNMRVNKFPAEHAHIHEHDYDSKGMLWKIDIRFNSSKTRVKKDYFFRSEQINRN